MDAKVSEWIPGIAILRRKRTRPEWRISRRAEDIYTDNFSELAAFGRVDRFANLGVKKKRVIYANALACDFRGLLYAAAILRVNRQWLFNQHMPPQFQRAKRDRRMRIRRRQDVNHIRAGLHHVFHRAVGDQI